MSWTRAASLASLAPGRGRMIAIERRRIALFVVDGAPRAIDDTCPHRGGSLSEGEIVEGAVECPLHGWMFDVCSGAMRGTSGVRVATYPAEIRDGDVWIQLPE